MGEENIIKVDEQQQQLQQQESNIFREVPLRYLGYANEVGESFRFQAPKLVMPSYGQSSQVIHSYIEIFYSVILLDILLKLFHFVIEFILYSFSYVSCSAGIWLLLL